MDPVDGLAVEQVGAVLPQRVESLGTLLDEEEQIDAGGGDLGLELGRLDAGKLERGLGRVDRQQHLEEWMAAQVACRLELADEQLEREIRVLGRGGDTSPHPPQERPEARHPGEVAAQDDRAQEDADRVVELRPGALVDRGPDDEVLLARVAVEQHLEEREQAVEEGRALLPGELFEGGRELRRQGQSPPRAAEARDRRPGPVGGQLENRRHPLELARPVGELLLEGLVGQLRALPLREIRVLGPGLGQRRRAALGERLVERAQLPVEHELRPLVEDDVMNDELEDVLCVGEPDQPCPEQPVAAQIERPLRLLVDEPLRCLLGPALSRHVDRREREGAGRADHLDRPAVLRGEPGAKRLVPAHDLGERPLERGAVEIAPEPDRPGEVVGEIARSELVDVPELLLGERAARRLLASGRARPAERLRRPTLFRPRVAVG